MISVVPAQLRHVNTIARRMRAIDALECEAGGRTPKQALRDGCLFSDKAWTALVDGRPEAMFGVLTISAVEGLGSPWMLGTDVVLRHARALLLHGPHYVDAMRDSIPRLRNLVSCDNGPAIRLLRKLGFTVGDVKVMRGNMPFYQFEMC